MPTTRFAACTAPRSGSAAPVRPRQFLTEVLGFELLGTERGWARYGFPDSAGVVDVLDTPEERRGAWGVGCVHHLAWRVDDDRQQLLMRAQVEASGARPTPVIDRFWFKSVYFKEPGGVLFEIATDGPGFAVDEDRAHLGETLVLPPWLEAERDSHRGRAAARRRSRCRRRPERLNERTRSRVRARVRAGGAAGRSDAAAAARDRRQRARPRPGRADAGAVGGAAQSARQGARARDADGSSAACPRASSTRRISSCGPTSSPDSWPLRRRTSGSTPLGSSRWASRTAPTSPRACCSSRPARWPVRCCFARWCRSCPTRSRRSRARRCCCRTGGPITLIPAAETERLAALLRAAGGDVHARLAARWTPARESDVDGARDWLAARV